MFLKYQKKPAHIKVWKIMRNFFGMIKLKKDILKVVCTTGTKTNTKTEKIIDINTSEYRFFKV